MDLIFHIFLLVFLCFLTFLILLVLQSSIIRKEPFIVCLSSILLLLLFHAMIELVVIIYTECLNFIDGNFSNATR